jgi:trigger factor
MTFKTNKIDDANFSIIGTISAKAIENTFDKMVKQTAKTIDIQGFRKGKVPTAIVKQRYGDKITQDAQSEVLKDILDDGLAKLELKTENLVSQPDITKFDIKDDKSIDFEIFLHGKPKVDLKDYKSLVPKMKMPKVTKKEIEEELNKLALQDAPLEKIKRKRAVKSGDFVVIDFEGFKDEVPFDGGKAENYSLEIGSNSFIPGFEDQIIGMKYDEAKDIELTFPENYQSKDLAGAKVIFKVKLHEIQTKVSTQLDDEFAKKILPQEENATIEILENKLKEQLFAQKKNQYFNDDIKQKYIQELVKNIDFAVPNSIVEQEINQALNNQAKDMSEDEIKTLKEDAKALEKLQKKLKPEAINSVKATFIVDNLAKAENIEVSDQEVTQTLYYEAMMNGQDAKQLIKQYEDANYLPIIKMSMIETKVMNKIFDEALEKSTKE